MNIRIYGKDARLTECARFLRLANPPAQDILLLPIPVTADGETLLGTEEPLSAVVEQVRPGTLVAGYAFPAGLACAVSEAGGRVLDVERDAVFTEDNARISAAGCLGHMLTTSRAAPEDWRVGIIGYGRIGQALCRALLFLGAEVKVYTSREQTRRTLGACGIASERAAYGAVGRTGDYGDLDFLINTAPAPLLTREDLSAMAPGTRVIELASGRNFPADTEPERLPGIPRRMYPATAGRLYSEAILRGMGGGTK